jgi:hypothetical protein
MAEKHKSKYKAPKDFEKSQKPKTRKDLKDYTHDDKNGGLNPHSTGEIQDLVPRKTDKLVIDDVKNMVPEIKHRVYQDVKTGKYSPKEAKKIFKKLQIEDTEGYLDKLENIDHGVIVNSLEEQKLRSFIRSKIAKVLLEQPDSATPPAEDQQTAPDPNAAPQTGEADQQNIEDPNAAPQTGEAAPTEPQPEEPTDTVTAVDQKSQTIEKFKALLDDEVGVVGKMKLLFKVVNSITKDSDRIDQINFLKLLKSTAEKKMHTSQTPDETKE